MTMATDEQKARMALLPHQQRVVEEKTALDVKLAALRSFICTTIYAGLAAEERMLLQDQLAFMNAYSNALGKRIARFYSSKLEAALVDLTTAVDGQGQQVVLFSAGSITAQALREDTYRFMENFDRCAMFLNGLDPQAPQGPAEAAAWRNLALLARATAAAIEEEGR